MTCYVIDVDTSYILLLGRPWIHANWIVLSTLHQCFKYVDDKVIIRTVFAETQLFKRAENYFTDSLLYREVNKVIKELLSDSIDSGNAADSESEEDTHVAFAMKSIVTYLNESDSNDSVENDVEWVINKNVSFDSFVCLNDVLNSVKSSSLHMPLPSRMACMQTRIMMNLYSLFHLLRKTNL